MPAESTCRAVVVTCIDFRFFSWLDVFLRAQQLHGSADIIAWPGGGAFLAHPDGAAIMDALALSFELHSPSEVILFAHEDCGRFEGPKRIGSASEGIEALLRAATTSVGDRFPDATIRAAIFDLHGVVHAVSPVP